MEAKPREILLYETDGGRVPFSDWLDSIMDRRIRAKIDARLTRVESGNLGQHRSVGGGVIELKLHFGPGYRIYLGQDGESIVILLCGGDKGSQTSDIRSAREYWRQYNAEG